MSPQIYLGNHQQVSREKAYFYESLEINREEFNNRGFELIENFHLELFERIFKISSLTVITCNES